MWVDRVAAIGRSNGRGSTAAPLTNALSIGGVGKGTSVCQESVILPVAFSDGVSGTYGCSVVPESEIPGLLGFDSMERRRVLIDTFNGKLYEVGPGGYDIVLSPGSRMLPMTKAPTGHPMLPISCWDVVKPGDSQTYSSF